MTLLRHQLCYLKPNTRPLNLADKTMCPTFHEWLEQGYPLIYTRQPKPLPTKGLQLAIPYVDLITGQKHRLSYLIDTNDLREIANLPTLTEVFPALAHPSDATIRVFGSYCWQHITGKPYVHEDSDLDLLINYSQQTLEQLSNLLQTLRSVDNSLYQSLRAATCSRHPGILNNNQDDYYLLNRTGCREQVAARRKLNYQKPFIETLNIPHLDGEIRFKNLGDCALAELLDLKSNAILFKSSNDLSLIHRDTLYADFPSLIA